MDVQVTFLGPIRRPWPETSRSVEVADGTTVGVLLTGLGYTDEDLKRVALVINGKRTKPAAVLGAGDQVRVVLLAGGG